MEKFFWIIDLLIPLSMIVIGISYKNNYPKEINKFHGYRTSLSMKSKETWIYAHKRASKIYFILGVILCVVIVIIKLIKPISEEYLSLINVFLGIVFLIIPIPIIENELKNKFK
ncbi:SdpI family protein [Clostridium ihumii]|uniref:SdpI family protein n=1 Tax=Clostridium ihumii TaxID=1470356 RepID=UPI003D34CC97